MKSTIFIFILSCCLSGVTSLANNRKQFPLLGEWYIVTADNKPTRFIAFPAETHPSVHFFPFNKVTVNFLKDDSGVWKYNSKIKTLSIMLSKEKMTWIIERIEKNKVHIKDISTSKSNYITLIKV